jgi:uncharacterized membrane protein
VTTDRTEAFSDGVFAIAATLLILNVHAPSFDQPDVGRQLVDSWPAYLTYAISFLQIGIVWVNHHHMFDLVGRVDRNLLFLNLLLLVCIGFVPFPTGLVASAFQAGRYESLSCAIYGGLMALMGVCFLLIWWYLLRHRDLLRHSISEAQSGLALRRSATGSVAYLVGAAVAFVSPAVGLTLFVLIALYYVRPVAEQIQPAMQERVS